MRPLTPTTAAALASGAVVARLLVWVEAMNRTTGAPETLGLWTGEDHRTFEIDGTARTYFGAGGLLQVEPVTMQAGLTVRMHRLTLSPLAPEGAELLRGYDPRLAPVEIHRALFDPETMDLLDAPHLVLRGQVDEAPITTPEIGGEASAQLVVAGAARALTRACTLKKSPEALRARAPGDAFRDYAAVAGEVKVWWGEARASTAPAAPRLHIGDIPVGAGA